MTVVPASSASGMGTRSRARRATDRAGTLKTTKKKVATASVGGGVQKRRRPASASEGGIQKRRRPPSVSEGDEVPKAAGKTLAEASLILKLKKEAFGAIDLWKQRYVPGALERWVKAKEKEAKAEEAQPTKMVLKTRLSREFIDLLRMQQPGLIKDVPAEEFAGQPESFRRLHAMQKYIDGKMYAYQHKSQGYAEDEDEVTTGGESSYLLQEYRG